MVLGAALSCCLCPHSSVGSEHHPYKVGVTSSNLVVGTKRSPTKCIEKAKTLGVKPLPNCRCGGTGRHPCLRSKWE